jgi:hypothetical protein
MELSNQFRNEQNQVYSDYENSKDIKIIIARFSHEIKQLSNDTEDAINRLIKLSDRSNEVHDDLMKTLQSLDIKNSKD